MPTAEIGGTTIWYDTAGSGPVCLVMHGGLGIDHSLYRPAFDFLAERHTVVYYDHRGNGRSGRPPIETLTMERLADDAAALADHLAADRVAVLGHSYGGFVAQEFALRHPDRLAELILVDTTPGQLGAGESPSSEQGPPPPPELIEALSSTPSTDEEYEAVMRKLLGLYLHTADPATLEASLDRTIFDGHAMVRSMEILQTWSVVDRLPQIGAPTLVVVGRHDVATSWPQAYRIGRRVVGAEVVVFEDSGHMPFIDEPERFRDVLTDWLDRVGTTTRE